MKKNKIDDDINFYMEKLDEATTDGDPHVRRYARSRLKISVKIIKISTSGEIIDDGEYHHQVTHITNLSVRGLSIRTNLVLTVGKDYYIQAQSEFFVLQSKIIHAYKNFKDGYNLYGCRYLTVYDRHRIKNE